MVSLPWRAMGSSAWLVLLVGAVSPGCGGKERPPPVDSTPEEDPEFLSCDGVPTDRLPPTTGAYEQLGCNSFVAGRVTERGTVTVPASPGSNETVTLAVARVFSTTDDVKEDPIVYLDGGPGGASLENLTWIQPLMNDMSPDRDLIFVDQRGVGRSKPDLQCYDDGAAIIEAIDACYERLSESVNLNDFDTVNSARDFDHVRRALGYDQWNLLGISYGTRLGLTVMRDYPEGVRSALIDSVVPLQRDVLAEIGINGYDAIVLALDACGADPYCSLQYPDPMGQLMDVVEHLNAEPFDAGTWELEGDYFLRFVFELLYSPLSIAVIPRMIDLADQGDFDFFLEIEEGGTSGSGLSFGMHLSLHCSEEVPFSTRADYAALDAPIPDLFRPSLSGLEYIDWCEHWPVDPAPPSENEPVVSDIPTLVMAGEFDPITPPKFARAAEKHLTNAQFVLVENESHGASFSDCGVRMARAFFDAPEEPVSSTCLTDVPQIDWAGVGQRPRSTHVNSGKINFHTGPLDQAEIDELIEDLKHRRSVVPRRRAPGR